MSCLCQCCERYVEKVIRSTIVSNPVIALCFDCFSEWYGEGECDPDKIAATVRAKHGLSPTPPDGLQMQGEK